MVDSQQPGTRKRRASKLDDSDDNKRRGRPRVEKNDESAADRRRTQIRMAQRAYRQRKESTLEELRRRVSELSGTVDSIESIFRDCMDRLVSFGLPELAINELRMAAARIQASKLSGMQTNSPSDDFEGIIENQPTSAATAPVPQKDTLTPKNVPAWLDQTELSRPVRRPRVDDYLGLGYSIVLPETAEDQSSYSFRPQATRPTANMPTPASTSLDTSKMQVMSTPESSIPKEIKPPHIYSFQESSFARRILRSCFESGYTLLLDPGRNLSVYERVFKLCLLGRSRQELIERTKVVLERSANQPLELYDAPLLHIGGAGTHYPRRDREGNIVNRKPLYNFGAVGPLTLRELMRNNEQRLTADLTADIEGYEGEWFDAYDVEGYLQEKGIVVDPLASFAEVDTADLTHTPSGSSKDSIASPETPGHSALSDVVRIPAPWKPIDASGVHTLDWNDTTGQLGDLGYADLDGRWFNLATPPRPASRLNLTSSAKKTTVLDVAKFIRGLMQSAVCLGQTPGFRREEVDKSLANACFDVSS